MAAPQDRGDPAWRRFLHRIFVTLFFGPCYARWVHTTTSDLPLDPRTTWDRFTKRGGRVYEWFVGHYPPRLLTRLFLRFYYRRTRDFHDHARGIENHYDLSNEFYTLFLDRDYMFYSAADFTRGTETLEQAQANKANYMLDLIDPKPGERILDLGPGWGAMLKRIHERTGDWESLYGYTLSKAQKEFTDKSYGFHCELRDFITTEYEPGSFDKIFSIETMEHVRPSELPMLSRKLAGALRPGGRIVHQFFCQLGDVPPPRLRTAGFEVFPGSELSSLKRHLESFEEAKLRVVHHSVHDYRPTLAAWFDRLAAHRDAAIALVGVRNYNRYLGYFAEAWRLFQDRELILMRFVLEP